MLHRQQASSTSDNDPQNTAADDNDQVFSMFAASIAELLLTRAVLSILCDSCCSVVVLVDYYSLLTLVT